MAESKKIEMLIKRQRSYFETGATLSVEGRIRALRRLKNCILKHEQEINEALYKDLGKSRTESYMCETGLVLSEISYMVRHVKGFSGEKTVPTPLSQFCARSYVKPSPCGTVLIISPWNYPFLLAMSPLVDAIAAGNTAVIKPSEYSPHTSAVVKSIVRESFDVSLAAVVLGGRNAGEALLNEHFDSIFFTGSANVGRIVMEKAAKFLTPVTLELGGKSPCVVEKTADIKLAARRIVFGKFLNCGQTCVAPDFVYCDREIHKKLLEEIRKEIQKQFGPDVLKNHDYGRIINERHFDRLAGLMEKEKIAVGGRMDRKRLKIEPTVLDGVTFRDAIMQQEIFGPILPILTYESFEGAIENIRSMPHPLALYIFTSDQEKADWILSRCGFGGGCVNDTVIHLATSNMGFGGFGESGMGACHGKAGFDAFTHYKSIVDKKIWPDLPMRYQPYRWIYKKLIRMFLK